MPPPLVRVVSTSARMAPVRLTSAPVAIATFLPSMPWSGPRVAALARLAVLSVVVPRDRISPPVLSMAPEAPEGPAGAPASMRRSPMACVRPPRLS